MVRSPDRIPHRLPWAGALEDRVPLITQHAGCTAGTSAGPVVLQVKCFRCKDLVSQSFLTQWVSL